MEIFEEKNTLVRLQFSKTKSGDELLNFKKGCCICMCVIRSRVLSQTRINWVILDNENLKLPLLNAWCALKAINYFQ